MEYDMGTEIRAWQIVSGKLARIETTLKNTGKSEPYDLEPWIASHPEIVASDLMIIGRQVQTKSGPLDLLAVDRFGNAVIIELKRDSLPRECLAQAIDYASDVASWSTERLSEACLAFRKKPLDVCFGETFPDVDLESITINASQRIVLLGFSIESSLERMIEWLSIGFGVNVNAVILQYLKTTSGDEILVRTSIISDELEQERSRKQKKFEIPMSDDPGAYDPDSLKQLLRGYLSREALTNRRMRDIFLPTLLKSTVVTRSQLTKAFLDSDPLSDGSKVGLSFTAVSLQLGMKKNDFLRQVVAYEYPKHDWEKDNFAIRAEHRDLVKSVLQELVSNL
jgi:hypothetical protein